MILKNTFAVGWGKSCKFIGQKCEEPCMKNVLVVVGKFFFRVSASGLFHATSCLKILISYSCLLHISCILIHFKNALNWIFIPIMSFYIIILSTRLQCYSLCSLKSWNIYLSDKQSNCSVCCFLGLTHLLRAPAARRGSVSLRTCLSCMSQRRTQSFLTSWAWQHLWTALTAADNTLSTAFETWHKGSNWTAFFFSYNTEKPFFLFLCVMIFFLSLSLSTLFSHIGKLHRRLSVPGEVLLCRAYG